MLSQSGPRKRRFTIAVFGSRGDIYPLLAVGRALLERGHHVTFATPERFKDLVLGSGLDFHRLRPDPLMTDANPEIERLANKVRDSENGLRELIFPAVEDTYHDLLSAAADADAILFPMFIFPGPMAAERLGIPWVVIHFTPATINSFYDPPYFPPIPWLHPFQRFTSLVPRLFNPIAKRAIRSWYAPLHALRKREGFPPQTRDLILDGMNSPWLTVGLFSPLLGDKQRDWPSPAVITGFPFFEEEPGTHGEAISKFCKAGEPPLVATLGSSVSESRTRFMEATIEAAGKLNQRLLLIAGDEAESLRTRYASDSLLIVDYAPYSLVFPEACALIIAGSVGPLSHALAAGRPMLVVASDHAADQPDNALRAVRLGVARWLRLERYNTASAVAALGSLLQDPTYRQKAEPIAKQINREDCNLSLGDALEDLLARRDAASNAASTSVGVTA